MSLEKKYRLLIRRKREKQREKNREKQRNKRERKEKKEREGKEEEKSIKEEESLTTPPKSIFETKYLKRDCNTLKFSFQLNHDANSYSKNF